MKLFWIILHAALFSAVTVSPAKSHSDNRFTAGPPAILPSTLRAVQSDTSISNNQTIKFSDRSAASSLAKLNQLDECSQMAIYYKSSARYVAAGDFLESPATVQPEYIAQRLGNADSLHYGVN